MALSAGQEQALAQLRDVASESLGVLEILPDPAEVKGGLLRVGLSLETRRYVASGGMRLRDRERLVLLVPQEFPFARPSLLFAHSRFRGQPHVQWGRYICLWQASAVEWRPSDGMFGFLARVDDWFTAAGAGRLDPDDAPLHPPVAYSGVSTRVVARADAPMPPDDEVWLGRADMREIRPDRLDLIGWTPLGEWDRDPNRTTIDAMAILLSRSLPMEYPTKVGALIDALEEVGVTLGLLLPVLRLVALSTPEGRPALILLGAPMRRKAAGYPLRQHLTAWQLPAGHVSTLRTYAVDGGPDQIAAVARWMVTADVAWCSILEDRPEIVRRRDRGTHGEWLRGNRVLLLGCGAIGSCVAELVARAGAASLTLVDNGLVKPGILVRQRYSDADIGLDKATVLKGRIEALGLGGVLSAFRTDLACDTPPGLGEPDRYDLIIDATASRPVAHRLEIAMRKLACDCPMLSLDVSGGARHGSVAARMPEFAGGPIRVMRQAKLAAMAADLGHSLVTAFWPLELPAPFQPEPGCSEPTFVGSAADVEHHAAGLLNVGLTRLVTLGRTQASMDLVAGSWERLPGLERSRLGYVLPGWKTVTDRVHGYEALFSAAAMTTIQSEIRRSGRTRSPWVETGGLLFGEIDEAHREIWVDKATGPPPDSELQDERFVCGIQGTAEFAEDIGRASGGSSCFMGIWHTHPVSRARPSDLDMQAMVRLLHLQRLPPRRTAMVIVGFSASQPELAVYMFERRDFSLVRPAPTVGEYARG